MGTESNVTFSLVQSNLFEERVVESALEAEAVLVEVGVRAAVGLADGVAGRGLVVARVVALLDAVCEGECRSRHCAEQSKRYTEFS